MVDKHRSRGANQQLPSAADKLPPAKSTVHRTSADRLKLATGLNDALHVNSVDKAAKAFANFNVSRHAKDAVPPNYIDRHTINVKDPAAVHGVQRDLITQQLEHVPRIDARNPGLTLAIAKDNLEAIAKSLPGLQANGGKIELDNLLAYLGPRMNGTNVYSDGNPVARRLTTEMQFRSAAQAIVDRIANNGSAQQAESTAKRRAGKRGPKS
jgi:hypothetical protein